jgi:hypothetical protein
MKFEPKGLSITIHVGETTLPTLWVSSKNKEGYVDRKAIKTTAYNAVSDAVKKLGYEVTDGPVIGSP